MRQQFLMCHVCRPVATGTMQGPCSCFRYLVGDKDSSTGRRAETFGLLSFHMPTVNEDDEQSLSDAQ